MPTKVLVWWNNKESRVEVDIDANNRVTAIRRVGSRFATVQLGRMDGTRNYNMGREQAELVIATNPANRVELTFDAVRNRWNGLAGQVIDE